MSNAPAMVTDRRDRWALALLGVVLFGLAAWRVAFVLAGPDLDTDAYGHHAIARQILAHPRDLGVHWVWLPLFHYLQAVAVLLGATLTTVRLANVLVVAAIPLTLYALLRRRELDEKRPWTGVPALAALITAFSPLSMQMGTTGQPEPLFGLLTLLVLYFLEAKRPLAAAFALAAAALVRYEGWAILAAVSGLLALDFLRKGKSGLFVGWRSVLVVAIPAVAILGWAAARRPFDPGWFWFLKGTRTFANDALGAKSSLDLGYRQLFKDLRYYPYDVAYLCFGYPLWLVPLGVWRTLRREGLTFLGVNLAILAFITYVWIQRGSLGLSRHFMVLIPFYATLAAHGIALVADALRWGVRRLGAEEDPATASYIGVVVALGCAAAMVTYQQMDGWMMDWRDKARALFTDRFNVAAHLRTLPPSATIFCDEPSIEIFSGLDRHRFDRSFIGTDEGSTKRVVDAASREGEVYVATWADKLTSLRKVGSLDYRPPGSSRKDEEGLAVIRVVRK
jgi:hypothetical protein